MQKVFTAVLVAFMALAAGVLAQPFSLKQTFPNPNLTPNQNGVADGFGSAVAVVGNKIIVGALGEDFGALNAGVVYVFDGNTGAPLDTLYNPTPAADELFGNSVAGLGNDILVGAPGAPGAPFASGEVYLFNGTTGALMTTISNPNPNTNNTDQFGFSVAAVGSNILVGAPFDDTSGPDAGVAYLFNADGTPIDTLYNPTPNGILPGDRFGWSVAGAGNNALVGAPGDDTVDLNAGAAYLFDGSTDVDPQTFLNPSTTLTSSDQFGSSVSVVGNNILIGAPNREVGPADIVAGAAYLFEANSITPPRTFENPNPGPLSNDQFALSVAAFGNNVFVVIGAPQDDNGTTQTNFGSAYLFDGSTGAQLQLFGKSTPELGDLFGRAVAASGNIIAIGTPGDNTAGVDAGAVYLFSSNQPPVANAGADQNPKCSSPEGALVTLDGSGSTDPDNDQLIYTWSDNGTIIDVPPNDAMPKVTLALGPHTIELTVKDGNGGTATDQVMVTVEDTQPAVIAQITAPVDPIQVNTAINTSATFTDACVIGTHTALWDWADGSTSPGTVDETNGSVTGNHTYTTAGVYTLKLTVTDNAGKFGEAFFRYVVVYDPSAGYVTGGGWIDSPPGAYVGNPGLTGKANFGFVSKYAKGKTTPEGNTQFDFKVADLKFHSTSHDWLVVGGAHTKYKGSGTINNSGDYGFLLTATDGQVNGGGGVDKFRIKIWSKATETVVYDNQLGASDDADAAAPIEEGSIVIHSTSSAKSSETSADDAMPVALPESYALFQNYPNPFNPETEIRFALPEASHVTVKIFNTVGENIRTLADKDFAAGSHTVRWNAQNDRGGKVPSGLYFYQLVTPRFTETKRMILAK